jgi:hypothetical protein
MYPNSGSADPDAEQYCRLRSVLKSSADPDPVLDPDPGSRISFSHPGYQISDTVSNPYFRKVSKNLV